MKTLLFAGAFVCLLSHGAGAQINETFVDGDFTASPSWSGDTASWMINTGGQLQSRNTTANASFYLSTPNAAATETQWDFYCQLTFNPSSANFVDVYLTASASNLSLPSTTGYFVRLGNTADDICLYRKDAGAVLTKIIDGVDGTLNTSNNSVKVRVIRTAANLWKLQRDLSGTGNNYFTEGSATDATFSSSAYFGLLVKQSTASFFGRHFLDDIRVDPYVPDIIPPAILSVTAVGPHSADVLFNEEVDSSTATDLANYLLNAQTNPTTAVLDPVNRALVHLQFADNFAPRVNVTMSVNGVADVSGNVQNNGNAVFIYYVPAAHDIVIDEIMADPTPAVQLPGSEWVELKNTMPFAINLAGWKLGKLSGESGAMPNYILAADSFVTVCTASAFTAMQSFGAAISVTDFPALSNTGDEIYVKAPDGSIVHAVNYSDDWYGNSLKKDGGWSLEMIDPQNACAGSDNWTASRDDRGGSPSAMNSVNASNADVTPLHVLRAFAPDSLHVMLVFNEPVDSVSAAQPQEYTVSDNIGTAVSAIPQRVLFDHVLLTLTSPLERAKIYTVTVSGVSDCAGNAVGVNNTARVGPDEPADSNSIVVNEILFNPKPDGVDYAELYNRSSKILNLKNVYLANRDANHVIASVTQCSAEDYLFFPGDYAVITAEPAIVSRDYLVKNPDALLRVGSTPSFNDDAGDVVILDAQGAIIDEVAYTEKWHFALINNDEGVALERIDPDAASIASNFRSAANSAGFGTPTYKNSQYRAEEKTAGTITVSPPIISPDNDGRDDFATIDYRFPEAGYMANISIFDANGRPVRYAEQSVLCGTKGSFRWDGLGNNNKKLAAGIYIVYTQIFNLKGKTAQFKNTVVVAGAVK